MAAKSILFSKPRLAEKIIQISYAVFAFITTIQFTQIRYYSWFPSLLVGTEAVLILSIVISLLIGKRMDKKQLFIVALYLLLGIIIMINTNRQAEIILLFGYILAGYELNSDRYLLHYIFGVTLACAITELLLICGVLSPFNYVSGNVDPNRMTLGFNYHSYLPNHFFHAVIAYIAYKKDDIKVRETLVILGINFVLYYFTKTSAAFLCVLVAVAVLWILKLSPEKIRQKISDAFVYSTVFFCGFSFLITLLWSPENAFMNKLNAFIHNRLALGNQGLHNIGVSLFGKDYWFNQTSGVYDFVDSSFLHIAIIYGVVVLVLLVAGFTVLTKNAAKAKRYAFCAAVFALMLHSFVEPQLPDLSYDPFLLMLGGLMLGTNIFDEKAVS